MKTITLPVQENDVNDVIKLLGRVGVAEIVLYQDKGK